MLPLKHFVLPITYGAIFFPSLIQIYNQFPEQKTYGVFSLVAFWLGIFLSAWISSKVTSCDVRKIVREPTTKLVAVFYLFTLIISTLVAHGATYGIVSVVNYALLSALVLGLSSGLLIFQRSHEN